MKRSLLASLFVLALIFLPFGGKIISTIEPGIVCEGEGPITIEPKGLNPPAFYVATPKTQSYANFIIAPGAWIIGLYDPIPLPLCATTTEPPVPLPVLPIIIFGVSMPSLI